MMCLSQSRYVEETFLDDPLRQDFITSEFYRFEFPDGDDTNFDPVPEASSGQLFSSSVTRLPAWQSVH